MIEKINYHMKVKHYSEYSKIYEQKLLECQFLTEQNITIPDIIKPLEDLITEEFIGKWLKDTSKGSGVGSKLAKSALAIGGVAKSVATAVINAFGAVFKSFGLDKLTKAIAETIKNTKLYQSIKNGLASVALFAMQNGLVQENNTPVLANIWKMLTTKCQSLVKDAGINQSDLDKAGASVASIKTESVKYGKLNEDKYDIGDDEVKYYGFFEKVVHALGIKNARFNGVVSQIMKKGAIGLAIMGILKIAGFTLGGLAALSGLGPVAMGVIGGMLLMAGIIILAIWICKPYPTIDDCLKYLHMYFGGNLDRTGVIFTIDGPDPNRLRIGDGDNGGDKNEKSPKPVSSLYPTMIKNLKALQSMLISFDGVKLQPEKIGKDSNKNDDVNKGDESDELTVGDIYTYINKEGVVRKVKLISLTNDIAKGVDKKWFTKDDEKRDALPKNIAQVIYPDKDGKYSTKSKKVGVNKDELKPIKESLNIKKFYQLILEKEFTKQPRNVEVTKGEDYLTQAFKNVSKSIKSIKDEKDKGIGITEKFIGDILSRKMDSKDVIKSLYSDIYEHLYGKYASTLPNFGSLYKESIDIISKTDKRKVVAEKIARLSKKTMQFEGENFYGGLGEFGADMEEFNKTLKQIMDSFKAESK